MHDVKIWMGKCAVRGCVGASPTDNAAALCACSSNEILPSGTEDKVKATFNTFNHQHKRAVTQCYVHHFVFNPCIYDAIVVVVVETRSRQAEGRKNERIYTEEGSEAKSTLFECKL